MALSSRQGYSTSPHREEDLGLPYSGSRQTKPLQDIHNIPEDSETALRSDRPTRPPLQKRTTSAAARHGSYRAALGLEKTAPIDKDHDTAPHHEYLWPRIRVILREPFAEFWGVFIFIMFGDGGIAQVLLSERLTTAPGVNGFGSYQTISFLGGFLAAGVVYATYIDSINNYAGYGVRTVPPNQGQDG
ncbi:MAG: hypothetical protein Q9159_000656 [Coniocarpon cinnabarinum]